MRQKLYLAFGDTFICAPLIKTSAPNSNDRHSVINTGVRGHCMKLTRTRAFGELLLRGECFDSQISINTFFSALLCTAPLTDSRLDGQSYKWTA